MMKWIVEPEWVEDRPQETKLTSMDIPTVSPPEKEVTTLAAYGVRWVRQENNLEIDRTLISVKVTSDDADKVSSVTLDGMEFFINEQGLLISDVKITFSKMFRNRDKKGKQLIEVAPMHISNEQLKQIKPLYKIVSTLIARKLEELNIQPASQKKKHLLGSSNYA